MKTRLDKLNDKVNSLLLKKEQLENRQIHHIQKIMSGLKKKGIGFEVIAGFLLDMENVMTVDRKEAWHAAGEKFLKAPRRKKNPHVGTKNNPIAKSDVSVNASSRGECHGSA